MEEQSLTNQQSNDTDAKVMFEGVTESAESDVTDNQNLNNLAQDKSSQTTEDKHSLGKFKSIDELQKAYKSLEAEFTKRSQKLSELENKKEVPLKDRVENFLNENPLAKNHIDNIIEEIKQDRELANKEGGLNIAYNRALEKMIIPEDKIATDSDFLDKYIYSNPEVQNKIITSYLSNIKNSHPYNIMGEGGNFTINPKNKPMSIKDCGEIVQKMFN